MAKNVVEVRECDRCGKDPAHTWVITGPEGGTREIELCERHSSPVANAFALGRAVVASAAPVRRTRRVSRPTTAKPAAIPNAAVIPPEPVWR